MFQAGQPAAVICHRPWTVVEADLVCGRTLTSWPSAPGFPGRGGRRQEDHL
jgi:putative intracellular protease/amidase